MQTGWYKLMAALALLALTACSTALPAPFGPTATLPAPTATFTPAAPTETPAPTPTSTPTPFPTPNPALALAEATAGLSQVRTHAGSDRLLCLRYEDLDADGQPEWLALVYQEGEPGRLSAFVIDGSTPYPLIATQPGPGKPDVGLGQYPVCEIELRDLTANGLPEIAIFGHADNNETLLHLFSWDGGHYRRLGYFAGSAGVEIRETSGALSAEIWEGYQDANAPEVAWYVIHTWREGTYGWTSDWHRWYALGRPHTYYAHRPQYAVISYYLALNDRDLPGAYELLTAREGRDYASWAVGYATTAQVHVGGVHTIPGTVTENSARVAAMVTAWDNEGGVIIARIWNTEWNTTRTAAGWRLVNASAELLEEWVVPYWP